MAYPFEICHLFVVYIKSVYDRLFLSTNSTNSKTLVTPSLKYIFFRWVFTVSTLTDSFSAISCEFIPLQINVKARSNN
ncbi:hypothetical protein [Emticicia aquatilis]|uniref:hypothetical protein n=1 Tax=Emticicia aquatilis TaxID=1537369 RepID=UPI0040412CDC